MHIGTRTDAKAHFQLLVSFLIVRIVVAQGQCMSVKIIILQAVMMVHPLDINKSLKNIKSVISTKVP